MFCGARVELPEIPQELTEKIFEEERSLIERVSDSHEDLFRQLYRWSKVIDGKGAKFKHIKLLPHGHGGAYYLLLGTKTMKSILIKAKLMSEDQRNDGRPVVMTDYFDAKKLCRALKIKLHVGVEEEQLKPHLFFGNELLRTDGVDAQVVCGSESLFGTRKRRRKNRRRTIDAQDVSSADREAAPACADAELSGAQHEDGEAGDGGEQEEDGDEDSAQSEDGDAEDEVDKYKQKPRVDEHIPMVGRPDQLHSIDWGKHNILTMGRGISDPSSVNAETGDGGRVTFQREYCISAKEYAEKSGGNHRTRATKRLIGAQGKPVRDAYEAAQKAIRDANAKTTDPVELEKSLKVHVAQYRAIAVITQMREKFNVKIRTQRALDEILNHILPPNDKECVVTNGNWVTSEGSGLEGKVYRYIRRHPRVRLGSRSKTNATRAASAPNVIVHFD